MRLKAAFFCVLIIVMLLSQNVCSQFNNFDCGFISPPMGANNLVTNPFTGVYKPTRTDISSNPNAVFPILVVFVQFKDEELDPRGFWPKNGDPAFLGDLIAQYKSTSSGNF